MSAQKDVSLQSYVRLQVLVPTHDAIGRSFPPEYFGAFEYSLVRAAQGFTRVGLAFGAWAAPDGSVVRDESLSYVVACPQENAAAVALRIQTLVTVLFEQQAAFVELTSVELLPLTGEEALR